MTLRLVIGPLLNTEVRQRAYRTCVTSNWALGIMRLLIALEMRAIYGIRVWDSLDGLPIGQEVMQTLLSK